MSWLSSLFKDPAPPPGFNYAPLIQASIAASDRDFAFQQQQFDWAKGAWEKNEGRTDKVIEQMLQVQEFNAQKAKEDREFYEREYRPVETQQIAEAKAMSDPAYGLRARGRAEAGVAAEGQAARERASATLQGFGINPGDVRYAALDRGLQIEQAGRQAAASEQAGLVAEAQGRAARADIINTGKGYPSQIAQTYGTALASGAAGVNAGIANLTSGSAAMGTPVQYAGLGQSALGTAGSTALGADAAALNRWKADQATSAPIWGILGTVAGAASKAYGFAEEGGDIEPLALPPDATPGGAIPPQSSPSGGRQSDDVSARLTAGEFVIPKDVAEWLGEKHLQNMILKAREDKSGAGAKPKVKQAIATPPTFHSRPDMAIPLR